MDWVWKVREGKESSVAAPLLASAAGRMQLASPGLEKKGVERVWGKISYSVLRCLLVLLAKMLCEQLHMSLELRGHPREETRHLGSSALTCWEL